MNVTEEQSWELPNPFLKEDHTLICDEQDWQKQREAIKSLLAERFYGRMPPRPQGLRYDSLEQRILWENCFYEKIRIYTGPDERVSFCVHIYRPLHEGKTIPVIMTKRIFNEEFPRIAVKENFSVLRYEINEAAPDDPERWNQESLGKAYPEYSWRAVAMWAWMAGRVIDYLETQDFADLNKVVVTGHSRFGKTALCCGIYDDRVAVTAPAGSGCGGMGSLRMTGGRLGKGIGICERIGVLLRKDRFFYWFKEELAEYGSEDGEDAWRENEIPFDANLLSACIAPRGLIAVEGLDDIWTNPYGTQTAWLAVSEVYRFLGAPELCALHYREGGHEYSLEDWRVVLDFARVTLNGEKKQTRYRTAAEKADRAGFSWSAPGKRNEEPEVKQPESFRQ